MTEAEAASEMLYSNKKTDEEQSTKKNVSSVSHTPLAEHYRSEYK
jgi:hypothetical protein